MTQASSTRSGDKDVSTPTRPFLLSPRALATALAFAGALLWPPHEAAADFRICNDTRNLVGVALGYREKGGWITEGWWQVPGETCATLIEGNLNSRFYYLYAEDADRGGQWRGDIFMCTSERQFRVDGVENCFARGYQRTGFFEVDTSEKDSWMVRLTESGQTGESR